MNEQTAATNPGSQTGAFSLRANPRRFDPFVRRFYRLAALWKTETDHVTNLTEKCNHAAYRAILHPVFAVHQWPPTSNGSGIDHCNTRPKSCHWNEVRDIQCQ